MSVVIVRNSSHSLQKKLHTYYDSAILPSSCSNSRVKGAAAPRLEAPIQYNVGLFTVVNAYSMM